MLDGADLAATLRYAHKPPNRAQAIVKMMGESRLGGHLLHRLQTPIDRFVNRVSGGKTNPTEWLSGLRLLWVTTTGARSGQPRTSPLIGVPQPGSIAVLGTSHGSAKTPSWVYNLDANPMASVKCGDIECQVVARRATEQESKRIWQAASKIYGGYHKYQDRITDREVAVFILDSAPRERGNVKTQ